ncbi:unnamed protein product [Auanema sp. JU1783]|nr:unnamed protein product [Auanema sp. JU1783]
MLTDRLSRFRFGSLRTLSPRRFRTSSTSTEPSEVQSAPPIPLCQMDYTVTGSDTLERIAAFHDCTVGELMKLNRMSSRMVFPGQKLIVPIPVSDDVFEQTNSTKGINNNSSTHEAPKKGPGHVVPAQKHALAKSGSAPVGSTDETDVDCLQRFLKVTVKQVTEIDGTVAGTLLVTPNCLMFDPDVSHPLVKENGQNLYGMVANMDEIISVSLYKEIAALTGDRVEKKKDIFDPNHVRTPDDSIPSTTGTMNAQIESNSSSDVPDDPVHEKVVFTCDHPDSDGYESAVDDANGGSSKTGSESFLPAITEESKALDSPEETDRRRAVSDLTDSEGIVVRGRSKSPSSSSEEQRPRSFSELDTPIPNNGINRFSPDAARRSFGKLGRTLSARARSVHQSVSQGTKTVAHGVVTHTKSAADSLQSGIETSVKAVGEAANAAANQAKAAADAVAGVPSRMVDMGTSLVSDGISGVQEMFNLEIEEQKSPSQLKRDQSLATLEELRVKTQQARDESVKTNKSLFACATSSEEMPDLFMPVDEMMKRTRTTSEAESPQLPYFMAVRLTRSKKKQRRSSPTGRNSVSSYDEQFTFGNKLKREFWFAIPRNKADSLYHFLLQWSPEKYGQDTTATSFDESALTTMNETTSGEEKGFLILDSTVDESLSSTFSYLMNMCNLDKRRFNNIDFNIIRLLFT